MDVAKIQIIVERQEGNKASSKAPQDVALILDRCGFERINLKTKFQFKPLKFVYQSCQFGNLYSKIPRNAIVFLQNPIWYRASNILRILRKLKEKKNVRFICLIHDIEELRDPDCEDWLKKEFQIMIDINDVLIVHNARMATYLSDMGIRKEKMVELGIFDYLDCSHEKQRPEFDRSISVAGNLSVEKANYIRELKNLKNIQIHLYGPNFSSELEQCKNIEYHGSFHPDELPNHLNKGFGLVWDGNDIFTCSGKTGNYLKYNNPHKLSLYLASGLPVVIWDSAAEAEFVKNNNIGICVNSLNELETQMKNINKKEYDEMVDNVFLIKDKLESGFYTQRALTKAISKIQSGI